jgi:hypothetical protein
MTSQITYPALVILIVARSSSLANEFGITGPSTSIGTHLSFVNPHGNSTMVSQNLDLSEDPLAASQTREMDELKEVV